MRMLQGRDQSLGISWNWKFGNEKPARPAYPPKAGKPAGRGGQVRDGFGCGSWGLGVKHEDKY
jgi:hypothetical protein